MDPTILIDERIDVVVVFRRQGDIGTLCVPSKMRWRGREIALTELALRHPTTQGKRMLHVFHMSDGANGYRIEFDAEGLFWTLVSMIDGDDLGARTDGNSGRFHDGAEAAEMYREYHELEYEEVE